MMNDPRHVTNIISQATIGGVNAFPNRAAECVTPCAKPRLPACGSRKTDSPVHGGKTSGLGGELPSSRAFDGRGQRLSSQ